MCVVNTQHLPREANSTKRRFRNFGARGVGCAVSFDATQNAFLEKKRSRSTSVLLPSQPSNSDKDFMASFFGQEPESGAKQN